MTEPILIDDPDDQRLADFREMNDQAARRRMEGDEFFLSEGWLSIEHLFSTGHALRAVLLSPSRVNRFRPFMERPELEGVPVFVAEADVMEQIVGFKMPRAVVMSAARRPLLSIEDLLEGASRLLVLEALNDNENLGAIARTARAFGVDGLLLSPTCTDSYYRRTVRVSMGEILHLRIARASREEWPGLLDRLETVGFETWALTPDGSAESLWNVVVPDRLAVMLGAEGPGLTESLLDRATARVRIPISADVDSLNVGHAAAIVLAAVRRPS